MKMFLVATMVAVMALTGFAHAEAKSADATAEFVLLLQVAEEMGLQDYEMYDVLQGYREYRDLMDNYEEQRDEKKAALEQAIEDDEGSAVIMGLVRDLMNIDMNILRLQQSSVNEAGTVLGAKAVGQLYLILSDLDAAKAGLVATLTGVPAVPAAPAAPVAAEAVAEDSEESILEQAVHFLNKLAEQDLDEALATISNSFEHYEYGDKEELRFFLDQAILMGYLDDLEINVDDTEVKLEDDKAVIYPIDVDGLFGSFTMEITVEKEDGKWMVTSIDVFGI